MSDPLLYLLLLLLFRIISVLQNSILLEYYYILQSKHLAFTASTQNSSLNYFKEMQGMRLDLVRIQYRNFEVIYISVCVRELQFTNQILSLAQLFTF